MEPFSALLLDIEGTITSISFVKDELFPYAFDNVDGFLVEHFDEASTQIIIGELRKLSAEQNLTDSHIRIVRDVKAECVEDITHNVRRWITQDKKLTSLKALQGLIWEEAYARAAVKGHIYDDVPRVLRKVVDDGIPIYIYSSGSVHAQKLLFSHSVAGDLTQVLSGFFDTNVGPKAEAASYKKICELIAKPPGDVLFLTDVETEARAATTAGLQVKIVKRDGNAPLSDAALNDFPIIFSLDEIL